MKQKLTLLVALLLACNPEEATPTTPIDDSFDPSKATLIKSGSLIGVGHTVDGKASVYEQGGKHLVVLDPYSSQNGPDLKVYFSADENATSYVSLGKLKSTNGKQSYEIPAGVEVMNYGFVLIWCEQFTVLFGKAELSK